MPPFNQLLPGWSECPCGGGFELCVPPAECSQVRSTVQEYGQGGRQHQPPFLVPGTESSVRPAVLFLWVCFVFFF